MKTSTYLIVLSNIYSCTNSSEQQQHSRCKESVSLAKMNLTEDSNTTLTCAFDFLPLNPTNVSPGVFATFIVKTIMNVFTCPFTIVLNILVMIAVKTKRQLRIKSNIALCFLATTDFIVGLVLQPLQIATFGLVLKGGKTSNVLCTLIVAARTVSVTCTLASLYHLFVMSGERYLAIKHSLAYETSLVTEVCIMMASGLSWVGALIIFPIDFISEANRQFMSALTVFVTLFVFIPAMIYFHVTVHKEVRRNKKQIITNQVSLEAKAKLLKNRKSFYTTPIILLTVFVCYIPTNIWIVILAASKNTIPVNVRHVVFNVTSSLLELNSLFNPLIYAVRIRCFRVAFIQLLSRKTLSKAQEVEKRLFGSKQSGAGAITNITNQQQNKTNGEDEVKEATLKNVQETHFNGGTQR